jgi:hypothetical protein
MNNAGRVMSEIAVELFEVRKIEREKQKYRHWAKNQPDVKKDPDGRLALDNGETRILLREMASNGELATIRHAGSTGYKDSLLLMPTEEAIVSREDNGLVTRNYGNSPPSHHEYTQKKGFIEKATTNASHSSRLRKIVPSAEVSVTPVLNANLSMDGLTQGGIMETASDVSNIHDAINGDARQALPNAQLANGTWADNHRNWSMAAEFKESYIRMLSHMEKLPDSARKRIEKSLFTVDSKGSNLTMPQTVIRSGARVTAKKDEFHLYAGNLKRFTNSFFGEVDAMESARASRFSSTGIKAIGQYSHPNGDHTVTTSNVVKPSTNAKVYADTLKRIDDEYLGSSPSSKLALQAEWQGAERVAVDSNSVITQFESMETLGGKQDTSEHKNHLARVISGLVSPLVDALGSINVKVIETQGEAIGKYSLASHSVLIKASNSANGLAQRNFAMSNQEVYAHEMVHPLWKYLLDANNSSDQAVRALYRRLDTLYEAANSVITHDDFLTDPANATKQEVQDAKEFHRYIFSNIDEFATYGLTNELVIKALSKVKTASISKTKINSNANSMSKALDYLYNIFADLVNMVVRSRSKSKTVDKALYELADEINRTYDNGLTRVDKAQLSITEGLSNKIGSPLSGKVAPAVAKVMSGVSSVGNKISDATDNTNNPVAKAALSVAQLPFILAGTYVSVGRLQFREDSTKEGIRRLNNTLRGNSGNSPMQYTRDAVASLLTDILGTTKDTIDYARHLRLTKHNVDAKSKQAGDGITKQIKNAFDPSKPLTKEAWKSLGDVIVRTDLQSIVGLYNAKEVHRLLSDKGFLQERIDAAEARLKSVAKNRYPYYMRQADGLAYHLVNNNTVVRGQDYNIRSIAELHSIPNNRADTLTNTEVDVVATALDEIVTLKALAKTKGKELVADVWANEFAREKAHDASDGELAPNGVRTMLDMHNMIINDALENNFKGDQKYLQRKGYVKEKYADNIRVKVAPVKLKKQMEEAGYVAVGRGQKDFSEVYSIEPEQFYVNTSYSKPRFMAGTITITNPMAKGANLAQTHGALLEVAELDEVPMYYPAVSDVKKSLDNAALRENLKLFNNSGSYPAIDEKRVVRAPVRDTQGNTIDYVHTVSDNVRRSILSMEEDGAKMLGETARSNLNKSTSRISNKQIIEMAANDYLTNYKDNPEDFVLINDDKRLSKRYRDLWAQVPEDMKREAMTAFGVDGIYMRKDVVLLTLGYRKISIFNFLDPDTPEKKFGLTQRHRKAFHKFGTAYGAVWAGLIAHAKTNIVLYMPEVLAANAMSNVILSVMNGVPLVYTLRHQTYALTEVVRYKKLVTERDDLERLVGASSNRKGMRSAKAKLARLNKRIEASELYDLIENEGFLQNIVEDVEGEDIPLVQAVKRVGNLHSKSVVDKIENFFTKAKEGDANRNKAFKGMDRLTKEVVITPDSAIGVALKNTTQYSDFVARYAMFKYMTEVKKMNKQKAIDLVMDSFVDYEMNNSPEMQWVNDVGLVMFTKFLIRIQRVIARSFREHPGKVVAAQIMEHAVHDSPDILDSSMVLHPVNRLTPNVNNPFTVMGEADNVNLPHYFSWLF